MVAKIALCSSPIVKRVIGHNFDAQIIRSKHKPREPRRGANVIRWPWT
jgi:hypothetical protein